MRKKRRFRLLGLIVLVIVGVLAYKYITKKVDIEISEKPFSVVYSHEKYMEGYDTYYNFVKSYEGTPIEDIVISKTFEQDGVTYTTNAIRANAFLNNEKVKTIDIPSSVYVYEMNILKGCEALEKITLRAQDAAIISGFSLVFDGIDLDKVTFFVANEDMKNKILESYSTAKVIVDANLIETE